MSGVLTPERPDESGKGKGNPYQPPTVTEGDAPPVSQLEIDMIASLEDIKKYWKGNNQLEGVGRPTKKRPATPVNEEWKQDLNRREELYLGALPPCP